MRAKYPTYLIPLYCGGLLITHN